MFESSYTLKHCPVTALTRSTLAPCAARLPRHDCIIQATSSPERTTAGAKNAEPTAKCALCVISPFDELLGSTIKTRLPFPGTAPVFNIVPGGCCPLYFLHTCTYTCIFQHDSCTTSAEATLVSLHSNTHVTKCNGVLPPPLCCHACQTLRRRAPRFWDCTAHLICICTHPRALSNTLARAMVLTLLHSPYFAGFETDVVDAHHCKRTLYQESVRIHMHVHCGRTQQPCLETGESQLRSSSNVWVFQRVLGLCCPVGCARPQCTLKH